MKTQTIAGHKITLKAGQRYRAGRPFNQREREVYPVTIWKLTTNPHYPVLSRVVVDGLSYEEANALINAFNNSASSFEGRVW